MSLFGFYLLIVVILTVNFTGGAPAAPTNVRTSPLTCTSVTVSWSGVNGATGYSVEWMLMNDQFRTASGLHTVGASITSITLSELFESSQYLVEVTSIQPVDSGSSTGPVYPGSATEPVDQVNSTEIIDLVNSTKTMMHTIKCNGMVLVAPVNLTAQIVNSQVLMISWSYPSLLAEITFKVTYNLVSAYNTSAGMKSFAEYDEFNTTQTSFHFALVSSVTNYIFTITPYNAIYDGDSARIVVDDFSEVDLVEDPVIFFNLRLSNRTANSLSSSDINKINSELTRHMQSSINDACQCTLPSYTLKGSVDSCDRSQSNCAIYTGRLLGSDTASATEVFEMVEEWLTTQNGSLLSGTLSVDPNCSLRLLSPSDKVCSTWKNISSTQDDADDDDNSELTLLLITVSSGVIIVILCSIIIVCALCVRRSRKPKKSDLHTSSIETYALPLVKQDDERHYSVVVQKNPSYDHSVSSRSHLNHCAEIQNTISIDSIDSHSGSQQEEQSTMHPKRPRNASETTSAGYVEMYSSGEYCNADNITSDSLTASYLSVTQT